MPLSLTRLRCDRLGPITNPSLLSAISRVGRPAVLGPIPRIERGLHTKRLALSLYGQNDNVTLDVTCGGDAETVWF